MSHLANRGGGRKPDLLLLHYDRVVAPNKTGTKATCKYCKKDMIGIPDRMKIHMSQCPAKAGATEVHMSPPTYSLRLLPTLSSEPVPLPGPTIPPTKKHKPLNDIRNFVRSTTTSEKEAFDLQIARFIYADNSPFILAENKEFLKLIGIFHSGYTV
ncbi:MAG: hypothetical protein GY804_03535 [Alphaproteobacteria bacterium]|nr:hypothetical protein [Alphaproteobacteria bacterium]